MKEGVMSFLIHCFQRACRLTQNKINFNRITYKDMYTLYSISTCVCTYTLWEITRVV